MPAHILRWSGGLRGPQLHLTSAPTFTRRAALRAIAGAASLPAGCGRTASAGTVLRYWAMGREREVVTELVPEFERVNPGIRVKVQQLPWTAAHAKLLAAFAGDAPPDVCQVGNTWIPELA